MIGPESTRSHCREMVQAPAASVGESRAAARRRNEQRRSSSARDDDGGGFHARLREQLKIRLRASANPAPAHRGETSRAFFLCERRRRRRSSPSRLRLPHLAMFAPPICRRRWRDNAFPFRQTRRRRRQLSEHRSERSEQSNTAPCASSKIKLGGQPHEHDHVAIVHDRIAIKGGQPSELARLARGGESEVDVRGVKSSESIEQVGRIEAGGGDH